jgi:hypothetical protein
MSNESIQVKRMGNGTIVSIQVPSWWLCCCARINYTNKYSLDLSTVNSIDLYGEGWFAKGVQIIHYSREEELIDCSWEHAEELYNKLVPIWADIRSTNSPVIGPPVVNVQVKKHQ